MMIKTSVCVALACAGLSPVAAGLVFHARHATPVVAAAVEQTSPFGTLSDAGVPTADAGPAVASPTLPKHLGLAPQDQAAAQTTTETEASDTTQTPALEQGAASPDLVKTAALDSAPAEAPASPAPAQQQDAAVTPEAPAAEPPTDAEAAPVEHGGPAHVRPGMVFNINTASLAELNRIPGKSNIGRAIVAHRPYRSIDELVSHRVLRNSDFQRVKDKVKV